MDYEKKYNEALERMKSWVKGEHPECFTEAQKAAEFIFPELKENKDEKIRKALLKMMHDTPNVECETIYNIHKEECIAWLEKQGGQKPFDYENANIQQKDFAPKIEQKSDDKIKPFDEFARLTDFERTLADICIGWTGEELGWKRYIKDNADVLLKIAIKKFNSVQDTSFAQKPAEWSEQDERMYRGLHNLIYSTPCCDSRKEFSDWLNSLRPRIMGLK